MKAHGIDFFDFPGIHKTKWDFLNLKLQVLEAFIELQDGRDYTKGVSVMAVRKYMDRMHDVDVKRIQFPFRKVISDLVEEGNIIATTGRGLTGSYRLGRHSQKNRNKLRIRVKSLEKSEGKDSVTEDDCDSMMAAETNSVDGMTQTDPPQPAVAATEDWVTMFS